MVRGVQGGSAPPKAGDDSGAVFERAAEVFALLGTPLRLRMLQLLCRQEMNVTQLRAALGGAQPSVSQNLAVLYRSGVLVRHRKGSHVFYCVNTAHSLLLCDALRSVLGSPTQAEAAQPVLKGK